jgi:Domain of unknown function (DUF1874)
MTYLFNTNIVPGEAVVRVSEITASEAAEIAANGFTSAIGHESTAQAFGEIIGQDVPVSRIFASPRPGDVAVSLKLNGRLPEGQVLDRSQLEQIGYTMYRMDFHSKSTRIIPSQTVESGDYLLVHRQVVDLYGQRSVAS